MGDNMPKKLICSNCGFKNDETNKFCQKCGKKLSNNKSNTYNSAETFDNVKNKINELNLGKKAQEFSENFIESIKNNSNHEKPTRINIPIEDVNQENEHFKNKNYKIEDNLKLNKTDFIDKIKLNKELLEKNIITQEEFDSLK